MLVKIPDIIDLDQSNKAKIVITDSKGTRILYSYDTPIAMFRPKRGEMYRFHFKLMSNTTSRHYNAFIDECGASDEYRGHVGFAKAKLIDYERFH